MWNDWVPVFERREPARFRYSVYTWVGVIAGLFASGAMVRSWFWPPAAIDTAYLPFGIFMVGSIWFVNGLFLRNPLVLIVDDISVTALYLWGARKSWPRAGLRFQKTPCLSSRLTGANDVATAQGLVVFSVWPGLVGPRAFSDELTAPVHSKPAA